MREVSYSGIWKKTQLGDLIVITTGKLDANAAVVDGGFPFFTCAESVSKIDVWAFDTSAVLLAGNGSFSVKHYSGKFNAYQRTYVIEPIAISTKFLFWLIRGHIRKITENERGSTIPYIRKGDITDIELFLPPLAEQKAIAEKLDTLLAQVESTKARLERIPKILKRFRQSVLAAAVSGKLTEDWRSLNKVTPPEATLEKIIADREGCFKGKYKEPKAHLKDEEFLIPGGWKWASLDSLSLKIVDGTHHTPRYVESGIPFISVKDIRGGDIDFSNTKFVSQEEHFELSKRCHIENGDLLITKSGTIGRTAIVNTNKPFSIFVSVALIKPASNKVNMRFVDLSLQKWVNEIDVSSRIVGSAIKNLHLRDMKVLAVPFASVEEQTEIVRRVDQLFAYADTIETRVNNALERVNNLTQSILAKAFRGELTEQWRKDNPALITGENSAEALLQKIKAARASQKAVPRSRKRAQAQ